LIGVVSIHAIALFAFCPALFRVSSVIATFAGLYVFGTLGINLCYHRLLTHRGFRCSRTLEHFLALLGICCFQDTPAHWVAVHRMHHQHSDESDDPHSPLVSFLWSHMGWLWLENRDFRRVAILERYVKDLLRDRFYLRLERPTWLAAIHVSQWAIFFLLGAGISWMSGRRPDETIMAGVSMLVWGVFVRTVLVWHITWSVNSITHLWGSRRYETGEGSRNNWLVGIISNGEGWHNNHHAQPRAASHGHYWYELDVTFLTIRLLSRLGLVWEIVLPDLPLAGSLATAASS
jgi:stearoyl-CoA desaturase (delta-9 desaturase)